MSKAQREALKSQLGQVRDPGPQPPTQMREQFAQLMATMRIAAGVRTSDTRIAGRPALLVEPTTEPRPGTILYFHGGSGIVGSPTTAMPLTSALVAGTGVRAISVDYRLAPEDPFPAGQDDALAAYRSLLDDGVDPASVAIAGDSAGGGLSVGTCVLIRRAGLPMPAGVVSFSGVFDYTRSGASIDGKEGADPFFTRTILERSNDTLLGDTDPDQDVLSPATRGELAGFPPLLLQVGTNELLLDDSVRLAARAVAAEVDVILDVTADVPHVFQGFTGQLDEADQALARAAYFLTQHLGLPA